LALFDVNDRTASDSLDMIDKTHLLVLVRRHCRRRTTALPAPADADSPAQACAHDVARVEPPDTAGASARTSSMCVRKRSGGRPATSVGRAVGVDGSAAPSPGRYVPQKVRYRPQLGGEVPA
jgi:hypothetical protein